MQSGRSGESGGGWRVSGATDVTHWNIVASDRVFEDLQRGGARGRRGRECTELIGATITHPRGGTTPYKPAQPLCTISAWPTETSREPRAVRCLSRGGREFDPSDPMIINRRRDRVINGDACLQPLRNGTAGDRGFAAILHGKPRSMFEDAETRICSVGLVFAGAEAARWKQQRQEDIVRGVVYGPCVFFIDSRKGCRVEKAGEPCGAVEGCR